MKKLSLFSAICLAIICFSCNEKQPKKDTKSQTIKINICSEPQTLDPRKVRNLNDINVTKMFMEGLTRIGKDEKVDLALAKSIEVSDDLKTYTITLRDAKWSNGDKVTAEDFIYSWKKTLSPEFLSDYAFQLYVIKNGEAINKGKLPTSLLGVSSSDPQTLKIELENPTPYFQELLSFPSFFPVHAKTDKETPNWAAHPDTFVCNGPFVIAEWKHQNLIIASKNENYWDHANVKLERIEMIMVDGETGFHMFENKELDWDGSPFSVVPTNSIENLKEHNQLHTKPMLGTYLIRTNTSSYPLNCEKLRKSLALAIDRQSIVEHVTKGNQIPATGIVPNSMGIQQTPYFADGDKEASIQLFYEAMEENELTPEELSHITLLYRADERNHLIAQAIQQQWHEILGIHIHLEAVESKILFDRISKCDYDLAIGSWIADFADPVNFLEVFKHKANGTNNTNWEDLSYIEALEKSYKINDLVKRTELLSQCEQILIDSMPVIPIFYYTMLYVKEDQLHNVLLTSMGHIDFKWAYKGKK